MKQKELIGFQGLESYKALCSLAESPIDLTQPGVLNRERINQMVSSACGIKMLYATERVTEGVIAALLRLAEESRLIEKLQSMYSGDVINHIEGYPSDCRAVLHVAVRDFFGESICQSSALDAMVLAKEEFNRLEYFIKKINSTDRFTDLVFVGIGGSELGPKTLYSSLPAYYRSDRKVHFLCNLDPDNASRIARDIDLKKTMVVVASKSGTTLETVTNERYMRFMFEEAGLDPKDHFVSVSCTGTPMDDKNMYLECFHIWDYVGGRFSLTSMIGGVMLAFGLGIDVYREILRGANAMDRAVLNRDIRKNPAMLAALLAVWNRNFLNYPGLAVVPYSDAMRGFCAYIQQVEMESNGKRIDRLGHLVDFNTCPLVFGEPGPNAQHSFFQLLHQGTNITPVEFMGFKESQFGDDLEIDHSTSQDKLLANLFAQSIALATGKQSDNPNQAFPGNRPSHILLSKRLDPYTLGALLSFHKHKAAFQGFIWNINSFDQEGVQLGKVLANRIIDLMVARRKGESGPGMYAEGEAYLDQIESM